MRGGSDPRHDAIASLAGLFTFFPFPLPLALAARLALPAPGAAGERFEPGVAKRQAEGARGPWADALTREEPHVNKRGSVTAAR